MKPFLEETFLITEEDYVNMSLERKKLLIPKKNRMIVLAAGIFALCAGVMGMIFLRNSLYHAFSYIVLILLGMYAISYYDVVDRSLIRKSASDFYTVNQKALHSQTIRIYDSKLEILSENRRLRIPRSFIYQIAEGNTSVIIFLDKNEFIFFPKRIITEPQLEKLRAFGGDQYKKIEVR